LLGFTHFWLAGTSVLVGLFMWRKWYFTIHWIPLSLGGILTVAGIWSNDPLAGLLWFCNVQMLYALWKSPVDKHRLYEWLFVLTLIFAFAAIIEIAVFRESRPNALSQNASLLGFSGLASMNPLTGISGSRTYIAAMALFALFTWRLRIFALLGLSILMLFVPIMAGVADTSRFTPAGVEHAAGLRSTVLNEVPHVESPWYGLGYRSYVLETGQQRPHNVFILAELELGYLAFVWFGILAIGAARAPLRVSLMLLPAAFISEEMYSRLESPFVVFGLVLSAYYWLPKFDHFARIHARITGQRRDVPAA